VCRDGTKQIPVLFIIISEKWVRTIGRASCCGRCGRRRGTRGHAEYIDGGGLGYFVRDEGDEGDRFRPRRAGEGLRKKRKGNGEVGTGRETSLGQADVLVLWFNRA
jgi:hypothetical protein